MTAIMSRFLPGKSLVVTLVTALSALLLQSSFAADVNNKLVSRAAGEQGEIANGTAEGPDLTPDGKFVVFESTASNLVAGGSSILARFRESAGVRNEMGRPHVATVERPR